MKPSEFFCLGAVVLLAFCVVAPTGEKVIYEDVSTYNHIIVTEDEWGLRTLLFEDDGDLQSVVKPGDPDHLELPYTRAATVGLAFVEKTNSALIIGLGGGSIPMFLHKHYPRMKIDVVDIDPDIVTVARKYFGFREDEQLKVYVEDGRKFVEKRQSEYDIIILDAYGRDNIPVHLATREFFRSLRRALTPQGVVVGNIFGSYSNPLYDSMVRTYQESFEELYIFAIRQSENMIFAALPRKLKIGREELARKARKISKKEKFPFKLGRAVKYGYEYATEKKVSAPVLTDESQAPKAVEVKS